jgi:raffinose/stachyose/melibiose transport system permease protein
MITIQRPGRRPIGLAPLAHVPLLALVLFALGPLVLLVLNAFKIDDEANYNPIGWPGSWHPENVVRAWIDGGLGPAVCNSMIVSSATILGVCVVAGLGAYAIAKMHMRGAGFLTAYFLGTTTVPAQLFLVPLFFLWDHLHLLNLVGLTIIYIAVYTPFSMFLLRAYFIGLPTALEEAARLDGANELQVLWHVVVPLSKPAFLTVALIVGMWSWNEFMYAVTVLQQSNQLTVALTYQNFTQRFSSNLAEQNAAGLLLVLPIIVLYLLLQRRFIEGMTSGGLKL